MRRTDQRRDAVFALYQHELTGRPLEELLADAKPFTRELARGTDEHRDELDEAIARHAEGWSVDRIAPLERNIMRVALYEAAQQARHPRSPDRDYYLQAAERIGGNRACLALARKLLKRCYHTLRDLGEDALAPA